MQTARNRGRVYKIPNCCDLCDLNAEQNQAEILGKPEGTGGKRLNTTL